MTTATKRAAKQKMKEAGEIRAAWRARGVADGEFERVKALEAEALAVLGGGTPSEVDSLFR